MTALYILIEKKKKINENTALSHNLRQVFTVVKTRWLDSSSKKCSALLQQKWHFQHEPSYLKGILVFFYLALMVTSPGPHFRKCLHLVIYHTRRGRLNHSTLQHCNTEKHNGRLCFVLSEEFRLKRFRLSTKPGHKAQNNLNLISCCKTALNFTHKIKLWCFA